MRRKIALATAVAIAGLPLMGLAHAETWRFALEEADGGVQDAYAEAFKERIEEQSNGDITVEIYPYGSLGTSSQLTELVQQDAVQLAFASPGHLASVIPETGVFTLHFLFSDDNAINEEVLSGSEAVGMLEEAYNEQNLELLGVIPEGWMAWTADRPIRMPVDMQGFRIRTMTSPILVESYRAYGANPVPMPYSEVYSGLQLDRIDGQANPLFAIAEMGFHEVQDYLIQAKPAQFMTTLVVANDFYEGLPDARRRMIDEVTGDLRRYIFATQAQFNDARLEAIEESSDIQVSTLDEEQRAAFRELSMPVRDTYVERAGERGKRILETLERDIAAAEQEGGRGGN
ncbi:TRAP transporter substrate-binding protein [Modicisalibacter radicis]|uniref:TRAP transporter substrate-binding protein n=1 Tax=Halomonas sp. EAR18 TaxID=2518972 RepID=UPI00109C305E|nr:TRAP transporter substrate-binding protein DctP [Halomonas sp. EAR18]